MIFFAGMLIMACDDVVVEATGVPAVGAEMAYSAIVNGKHVVMVNVEADVTVGPILSQMADSAFKRLGRALTLPTGAPQLTFWISYDIELEWDYAFVEILACFFRFSSFSRSASDPRLPTRWVP